MGIPEEPGDIVIKCGVIPRLPGLRNSPGICTNTFIFVNEYGNKEIMMKKTRIIQIFIDDVVHESYFAENNK